LSKFWMMSPSKYLQMEKSSPHFLTIWVMSS
jgi:hypothetical protein